MLISMKLGIKQISGLAVVILMLAGFAFVQLRKTPESAPETMTTDQPASSTVAPEPALTPALQAEPPQAVETPKTIASPLAPLTGRATLNLFGNQPSTQNYAQGQYTDLVCPGGKIYSGYHTAVDLEVTVAERTTAVPVYSIAAGKVLQASEVGGYGGLLVIRYQLNGNIYTAYYGHLDLESVTVKKGDQVSLGQKVAELGPECSVTNGNVRKHLHFGLHQGEAIVVAGYVGTRRELANWIDPLTLLN